MRNAACLFLNKHPISSHCWWRTWNIYWVVMIRCSSPLIMMWKSKELKSHISKPTEMLNGITALYMLYMFLHFWITMFCICVYCRSRPSMAGARTGAVRKGVDASKAYRFVIWVSNDEWRVMMRMGMRTMRWMMIRMMMIIIIAILSLLSLLLGWWWWWRQ